ncbi:hypothetical protein [Nitratireductor rhodophyticola]|uniref:hypothetical protein n=1 Tax=Nitratireductor rhodophyticola TaxID=2854036 RepID=UPI0030090E3A
MSLSSESAGIEEVAAAIGRTPTWLRRKWLQLHNEHGFPRKHPTGWTWPRDAVRAWLRSGGLLAEDAETANDNAPARDPMAAFKEALAGRYGGSA